MGLRFRLTLLATALVALVSGLLLWLGWALVGSVVAGAPGLPAGATVVVGGIAVPADVARDAVVTSARDQVLRAGLVAFPLVVLAAGIAAWILVGRVLAPLHQVITTAGRLSARSLDERLSLDAARGEVAELAAAFDAMLDRLQGAFDAQSRFVANAGHELRTPLAVLRTEIDVTLQDPDADVVELRRMGEVVRDAGRRCDELVTGLLLLARTEAAGPLGPGERSAVDMGELLAGELDALAGPVADRGLTVRADAGPSPASGDETLLRRLVGNLLENAVLHNRDGGWIEASTSCDAGGPVLVVASSGAELDPDRVGELFEPFRRGPVARTARTRGSGLGLSIVRAVAAAHGGTVDATAVPDGGLRVRVRLSSQGRVSPPVRASAPGPV